MSDQEGRAIDKHRLKMFLSEAEALSFTWGAPGSPLRVVKLHKVKDLLCNLATGKDPDYKRPPYWAGKDVVGFLMRRGWKVTEGQEGMHRRGYFIPADAVENCGVMGSESAADMLEIEHAVRTDREDISGGSRSSSGKAGSGRLGPIDIPCPDCSCPDCSASGPRDGCLRCGGTGKLRIL